MKLRTPHLTTAAVFSAIFFMFLAINASADCVAPPPGLVSWWRGETNAVDQAGPNNGALVGNTSYGPGRVGQAFVFDGSGDAVLVGNASGLQLQNFTIEAWIRRGSSTIVSYGLYGGGIIFGYGFGGYGFYMDASGALALSNLGNSAVNSGVPIADTNFHHVAVTKVGNNVFFYVDGVAYSVPSYSTTFTFNSPAAIGARGDNLDNSFLGTIDEVSIYNRALSVTEIQAVYIAGSAGKCEAGTPPSITSQPSEQTVPVGGTATFNATAAGLGPLYYQWQLNGTNVSGATANSLVLPNVQVTNAGIYSMIVSNLAGTASSSNATLTVIASPPCVSPVAGLVSWWRAEANALDQAGTNHGTLAGNPSFGPGRVGGAFVFDGSGDAVLVGNPPDLQLQNFTIEAWIKRASVTVASFDFNGGGIFGYGSGGYALGMFDNGGLYLTRVGISYVSPNTTITDTNFHHLAVSKVGSKVIFYVDGVAYSTPSYDTNSSTFTFNSPAAIGARGDNLGNSFFGTIDEVSVYNRALSANEVQAIYNAGSAGKCLPVCIPHLATATAEVVNGFVVGATIIDGGCGYTNTPTVRIIGDGSGAHAVAVVTNGVVTAVKVQTAGAGYTKNPVLIIQPPFIPQPTMGGTLLLSGPFVTSVIKLDLADLSPYDSYQLEFRAVADGAWSNFGPPFSPTATTTTVNVNANGNTGFFRLKYVP